MRFRITLGCVRSKFLSAGLRGVESVQSDVTPIGPCLECSVMPLTSGAMWSILVWPEGVGACCPSCSCMVSSTAKELAVALGTFAWFLNMHPSVAEGCSGSGLLRLVDCFCYVAWVQVGSGAAVDGVVMRVLCCDSWRDAWALFRMLGRESVCNFFSRLT